MSHNSSKIFKYYLFVTQPRQGDKGFGWQNAVKDGGKNYHMQLLSEQTNLVEKFENCTLTVTV